LEGGEGATKAEEVVFLPREDGEGGGEMMVPGGADKGKKSEGHISRGVEARRRLDPRKAGEIRHIPRIGDTGGHAASPA